MNSVTPSNHPIVEIDHLLTYVQSLDQAAASFRRMGFTLSPVSHIESMGIANHLLLMQPRTPGSGNFVELMAAHDRAKLPAVMARTLAGEQGIKSMVLGVSDAAAARETLLAQGFQTEPPSHVRREWIIGPGESVFPEFDVLLPVEAPLSFNCCRYYNVELYLRPQWREHDNGALGLRSVLAVADRPSEVAALYARVFSAGIRQDGEATLVSPGAVDLVISTERAMQERYGVGPIAWRGPAAYLGYVVEVESCERLVASLQRGSVPFWRCGEKVCVGPDVGCGNLIVFEPTRNGR